MGLSEAQLRIGFDHVGHDVPQRREVVELSEYGGETALTINCTQLGDFQTPHLASAKEKKRVLREWCDYLRANPTRFTELAFGTRMPQELLDAVGHQRRLVKLSVKWGAYTDLGALENLGELQLLHLGSGAGVEDISPLTKLRALLALSLGNLQKITSYAPLARLTTLESVTITGDVLGPRFIKVDSLEFLHEMPQLRAFRLLAARLQSKDYRPLLALRNLEHLGLDSPREVKALFEELVSLPKLKWGLLKERPELYR